MMLSDCRHDDYYNKDFLDGHNEEFVKGYDWATEAVDNMFNDIDFLAESSDYIKMFFNTPLSEPMQTDYEMDFAFQEPATEHREVKTYGDLLRMRILEWLEGERNELITSMIDDMDEDLYKAIRNRVLKDNAESDSPKEYYDTRKYFFTGKKESDGVTDEE